MEQKERSAAQISEKRQDIKYDTRDYVIDYLVNKFQSDEFYIPESYQRNFVWHEKDMCFFIESVLMGLPIPFMFFADSQDGRIEIVDGAQRIQSLVRFVENDLQLSGLRMLSESNGMKFCDLDKAVQRRFMNTNMRVVFLEEGTTIETRQEIFRRINTGGISATPAEVRRGAAEGKFKSLLEDCAQCEEFKNLAPRTELTEKRFEGFEMAARFFAYVDGCRDNYKGYTGNVTQYIDDYVDRMNAECEEYPQILDTYHRRFTNMLNYAEKILGERGFRKTTSAKSTPRARFEALAVGIALALEQQPNMPVRDISSWINSEEFAKYTRSDAANNKSNLTRRIFFVRDKLLMPEE